MLFRIIIFLLLNFAALAIGGLFTGPAVQSEWYLSLEKAPWTPPGWVFGFMWTTIMLTYTFYMASAWNRISNTKQLIILYLIQWILNVGWNPVFFYYQESYIGFTIIVALTVVVAIFLFSFRKTMKSTSYLLLPYFLWLLIATSLNGYICIYN